MICNAQRTRGERRRVPGHWRGLRRCRAAIQIEIDRAALRAAHAGRHACGKRDALARKRRIQVRGESCARRDGIDILVQRARTASRKVGITAVTCSYRMRAAIKTCRRGREGRDAPGQGRGTNLY